MFLITTLTVHIFLNITNIFQFNDNNLATAKTVKMIKYN